MTSPKPRSLSLALLLSLGACGGDEVFADGSSDGSGEDGATEAGATGDTSASETSGDPEPPPPELGGPAMGISIIGVEANQGINVALTEGEVWVPSDQRNAALIRDRDTLIRFQHDVLDEDAWLARDLTGFLHIYPADGGEELVRERQFRVEADSDPRVLGSNFYFSVLAEEAQPGARFWLELRESDDSIDVSDLPEGLASAPTQPELFGFEDTQLEFKVMIVPVDYQWIDPPRYPDITDEDLQLFHDHLLQQNPVQTIDIQIREEPLVWNQQLTNLGALLGPTRALKIQDGAAANVYYHALVEVGGPSVNMVAGIANLAGPGMGESDRRVAATVYFKPIDPADEEEGTPEVIFPPTGSARTWVHEIGHNQGLSHVYCPGGNSAGDDPSYPYEDGKIGGYGFGIRDFHIYSPNAAHDYMSYCGNSWVSDWTWTKTLSRIQNLTAWDYAGAPAPGELGEILVGTLYADGSEDWWIYEAAPPARRSGAQRLEFGREGEVVAVEWADVALLSDGETVTITAPLPLARERLDAITRVDHQGLRHDVALERVLSGHTLMAPD